MRVTDLQVGGLIEGLAPSGPAEVRAVTWHGSGAATVSYRDDWSIGRPPF